MRSTIVLLLVLFLAGCSSAAPDGATGTQVSVAITDASFDMDVIKAQAGTITFVVENVGTMVHEFEVFSGAEAGQDLPIANNVADTSGLTAVDEVEDIVPGSTIELSVDLEPGTYLLICNLPGHYAAGNWSQFTVTR